jgi:2-polyprenyl-6-methoxyphenol hydroxylase-like FAD-dependent oxidoreductase
MASHGRALVVGAGLGGLAAAIAIRRAGFEVDVYEQSPQVREIGAGLSFWSNGLRAARALGVEAAVLDRGAPIEWLNNADWAGRVLQRNDVGRFGTHVAIQRADLLGPLLNAFGAEHVHTSHALTDITQSNDGVTAHFGNGIRVRGDLLVGADGVFSTARRHVQSNVRPEYAGHVTWRGIAPAGRVSFPDRVAISYMGRGEHFAIEPMKSGLFWYAAKNLPDTAVLPPASIADELREYFGRCADPIPSLIAGTPPNLLVRNRVYDLPRLTTWSRGHVVLLGDAAHAMRPNLGQGACQAVEDAVVLGDCLSREPHPPNAFRRFESRRRRRTQWIVYWSRQISRLEYTDSAIAARIRDLSLRLTPSILNLPWFASMFAFTPEGSWLRALFG